MAGTREGAAKRRKFSKEYYSKIGKMGGAASTTGGFAQNIPCNCDLLPPGHFVKNCAAKRGGIISRKPKR